MSLEKKLNILENTILEIGTENHRARESVADVKETVREVVDLIEGFRALLKEKDILGEDELDEFLIQKREDRELERDEARTEARMLEMLNKIEPH